MLSAIIVMLDKVYKRREVYRFVTLLRETLFLFASNSVQQ